MPMHGVFTNKKIALGITSVFSDTSDVYEERINDKGKYEYMGKYYPLKERVEVIKIKVGHNFTQFLLFSF